MTAAVLSLQRAADWVEVLVEPVELDPLVVEALVWPVEVDFVACPVGTGPASWAPLLLHPAATAMRTRAAVRVLVMRSIVRRARNPSGPRR